MKDFDNCFLTYVVDIHIFINTTLGLNELNLSETSG